MEQGECRSLSQVSQVAMLDCQPQMPRLLKETEHLGWKDGALIAYLTCQLEDQMPGTHMFMSDVSRICGAHRSASLAEPAALESMRDAVSRAK